MLTRSRTSANEWTSRVAKTSAIKRSSSLCRLKNMEDIVSTVLYIRVFHDYYVICEAIFTFLLSEQK